MKRITAPAPLFVAMLVLAACWGSAAPVAYAGAPALEITKNCPTLRYIGRDATFEIVVTNRGDGTANDVVITDVFAGPVQFLSADSNGARSGNNIVWRLGELAAGDSRTLTTKFKCDRIGVVKNSVTVTYCAEASDSCELEVKGIPAVLLECVDDPDPIELNGTLSYTISVVNQGTAVGTNIVIACTLPPEEEHVSTTGPSTATVDGQKVTFAPLPTLAPKARATWTVTVRGIGEGDVRFRVELTSDQTVIPVMETESTHIYQ